MQTRTESHLFVSLTVMSKFGTLLDDLSVCTKAKTMAMDNAVGSNLKILFFLNVLAKFVEHLFLDLHAAS